ncbi:MAG: RNA polymerase-associated protein RapA, partial [Gammaproteobacteria bacterium]|nr:RNA polymerase-associated protein RapA [Gammaproteobacteria bacterium]
MQAFINGQRWISSTETQLGLGIVTDTEFRTVTISYPATGEIRTYAKQTSPLTRVLFSVGDSLLSQDDKALTVIDINDNEGFIIYSCEDEEGSLIDLPETQLNHFIQLNRPSERLFNAQIDKDKHFKLRYRTLQKINQLSHSDLRGLTGCRTTLIPHQLYIAHEVAHRFAPRVLLADEVGLGKTIEAGLILHQQLITGRANRVLIVVPESLTHQWLVEMIRRFNLFFSVFDKARCSAITSSLDNDLDDSEAEANEDKVGHDEDINPFQTEQLVLCNIEFLRDNPKHAAQALQGDWDLLVVDEAHHLEWSENNASPEYTIIEQLANITPGVLLLTATPEQLGKKSHFARLRLLDADRFHNYDTFLHEEQNYRPVAEAIEALIDNKTLEGDILKTLQSTFNEGDNKLYLLSVLNVSISSEELEFAKQKLITHLLDRHGTGRVLFRNTRNTIKGFPERKLTAYPLPKPAAYEKLDQLFSSHNFDDNQLLLSPELLFQSVNDDADWTQTDPRIGWLHEKLQQLKPNKVLVITSSAHSALDIASSLKSKTGISAAVFHEGLSLIERDRAAAYFADMDAGTQVLICSEIGSEGRNFQFSHELVLFDLPINPDLLEQRIGRLDRIGQTHTINIHVPYLENSAQEIMYRWYHQGLSAFEHTCPAGLSVFTDMKSTLINALKLNDTDIETLIADTQKRFQQLNTELQNGRDRLLEYNSCRPQQAALLQQEALTQDTESDLGDYMDAVFDCFGIDSEIHSYDCFVIHPGDHMMAPYPGLSDEGMTITYDRTIALSNEDIHFISWDHPLVTAGIDLIATSELGNTAVTAIETKAFKPGTLMLECLYVLEPVSNESLQANRYLPPTTIRVLLDENGKNYSAAVSHEYINEHNSFVKRDIANKVVQAKLDTLKLLIEKSEQLAHEQAPEYLQKATEKTQQTLLSEAHRLKALRLVNPNVREEEIEFFEQQHKALAVVIKTAQLRLDALRVV